MEHLRDIFDGADIYYAELTAPQGIRLERNATENRLQHKPSKRNLEWSNEMIIQSDLENRLVSNEKEIPYENYLRIDNSSITPQQAAQLIKDKFEL